MSVNIEEQPAIWHVAGLAEVLAGPTHAGDDVVRFDRRVARTSRSALGRLGQRRLDQWGFVVVAAVGHLAAAQTLVSSMGDLLRQDNGRFTQKVTKGAIRTDASGADVDAAYVATFSNGGGAVDMLDVRVLVAFLDDDELVTATDTAVHFPGPDGGVHSPVLGVDGQGDTVVRFDSDVLAASGDDAVRRLGRRIDEVFRELRTTVVIPDGALLIWDNQRLVHAHMNNRDNNFDRSRRLTRFWSTDGRRP